MLIEMVQEVIQKLFVTIPGRQTIRAKIKPIKVQFSL